MYRSRLSIWISCVCIIICLGLGVKFVKWLSADPAEYNMYCTSSDNIIKSNISDISGDYEFNLYDTRENTDFIIQPTSNETINGYTKYANYIYSPLVLWARADATDPKYGFNVLNKGNSYSSTVYKDLAIILDAIENDKTFKDIGIDKKVAEGKVKLYIPNKMSVYYPLVEDLFYITLNNGKVPNDIERENLKEKVDALLEKCPKVEDVAQKMMALYDKDDKEYTLFLGPECIVSRDTYAFNTTNENAWMCVYLNYTNTFNYDLFVKDGHKDNLLEVLIESGFSKKTGFRIYNSSSFSDSYNHTIDNITMAQ